MFLCVHQLFLIESDGPLRMQTETAAPVGKIWSFQRTNLASKSGLK